MEKKEAMKILKEFHDKSALFSVRTALDTIIPELHESEDEKIRKDILAFIRREGQHIDKYKWHKWTAWLQKQGQKETTYDEDMLGAIEYCKKNNRPLEKEHIAWLEKQCIKTMDCSQNHQDSNHPNGCIVLEDFNGGEGFYKVHLDYLSKKQIEEVEEMVRVWNHEESNTSNENIKNCIGMCLTDVSEQRFKDYNTSLKDCLAWLNRQGELNPTWSKDDEEMLRRCISATFDHGYLRECDWLKSLKKGVQPQPKQEWSEEDEYNFAFIQEALLGLDGDDSYREKCCKMAEWLESLKERVGNFDDGYKVGFSAAKNNQWKPSDEQMERLKGIINSLPHQEVLYSLYQDLLKLKG